MTKRMNIIKALLEKLTEKYSNHFLSLNPTFNDIRPFQWHNFHQAQKGKYSISIKYTGVIDFNDFANFDKYIEEISYRRKSDLKKSKKFNFNIDESKNLEKFVEIYLKVFERQSIKIKQKI